MATGTRRTSAAEHVRAALRARISGGQYSPGQRLPAEPELARELNTSRVTLREALSILQGEGLIDRRHGAGTFVTSGPPVPQSLHINFSVESMIRATGHEPGTTEASWRRLAADEEVAGRLGLEVEAPIWTLERVRTSDDRPVIHSVDHLPLTVIGEDGPWPGASLYSFLRESGMAVVRGEATLEPRFAGERTAELLDVDPDTLCLTLRQVDFGAGGDPLVYSVEHHLADAFEFRVLRQGPTRGH
jgi:GntR family transcriptional regulator